MKFLKCCVLAILFCSVSSSPVEVNDLSKGISEFGRDFYSQCVKEKPGNVIVSPLSVATALSILSQAASGETYEEIKTGLHLSNDKTVTVGQFVEHRNTLEKNAGQSTLSIANKIYVQQGNELNKHFQDVAVSKFKSGVESLDFSDNTKSAKTINDFVEEKTNGKIHDLIKKDDLNSDTRSVIVNAIYFKGTWEEPFDKKFTEKSDFYVGENERKSVDFMYDVYRFNYRYLKDLNAEALEMKYANSSLSFVIVLPHNRMGLSEVESKLETYDWAKITDGMRSTDLEVLIPKFKVEYEIKLNDVLHKMEMGRMFSGGAELNGVLESGESLYVSEVVHKAFIEIEEVGTEAAAATGIKFETLMSKPEFRANHPFLYYIRDTETDAIIFSGRIVDF